MPVTHNEFLASAKAYSAGPDEIQFRNAISRGYYAAYHACGPFGASLPEYAGSTGGMHARFISRFTSSRDQSQRRIGYMLKWCHEQRCSADYDMSETITEDMAASLLLSCEKIIDALPK